MPFVPPMLATKGDRVPDGPDWVHEVKWDGIRVIVHVDADGVRVWSRNGNERTRDFPRLAGLAALGRSMVLDGELAAADEAGLPTFGALQRGGQPRLYVFDLLELDGRDLTTLAWVDRRAQLEALHLGDDAWLVPPTYDDGEMLLEATRQQGLEGIVSKLRSAAYRPGVRSRDWLKFPHRPRRSVVIGGWRGEKGSDARLGALLVGEPTPDGLVFRGRVGSGLAGRAGLALLPMLADLGRADSPFVTPIAKADALGTHWVEPVVVVDVESLGMTGDGRLRQPSYQGVRQDLVPADLEGQS
ncbi:non-homologous end-joining DNA ligase [Nocardioides jiangxiensis]|uniref:DNA ligase (ATP) n=1 Tax=Nocardioides jiangxiensis TaxID=3064524 RepID=A0ABT9B277_9ACTN|nr:non-homologous end-joining DNA ligase [Nocardioides sp. WY-20]MDO7868955.1 non-homologous end-joining DNA ligase [Nocardioides sp. WY-20]